MFYLFEWKLVDLIVFSFLQGKMCQKLGAPKKLDMSRRFCVPERTWSASGAQFVQAWLRSRIIALQPSVLLTPFSIWSSISSLNDCNNFSFCVMQREILNKGVITLIPPLIEFPKPAEEGFWPYIIVTPWRFLCISYTRQN